MSWIRAARERDAEALGELHVAAWRVAYGGFVPPEYLRRLNPVTKAAGWAVHVTDPKPGRHVLVHDGPEGRVDGFVQYGPVRGGGAEVLSLYVHPARQRRGAGSALLEAAEAHLARLGHDRLELWTFAENSAGLAFFAARGWHPDGGTGTWLLGDRRCAEVRLTRHPSSGNPLGEALLTTRQA